MKPIKGTGKIIQLDCQQLALPEFPNLLFGTQTDGSRYFDATFYLQQKDPEKKLSVEKFFEYFDFQIQAISNVYELPNDSLVLINHKGHQLINGCLCYPFLSYVDPQFCAYINEMIEEVFVNGIAISDSYLMASAKRKLTPELWKQIWNDDNNEMVRS